VADLTIETTHGRVRGAVRDDVASWRGIPYAAAPVGALRFRPPRPPARWAGERDATRFGPVAPQSRDPGIALLSGVTDKVANSEDCLLLNVFAPAPSEGDDLSALKRPVMVWIHGGAFIMGSGSTPLYHGLPFAQHDIVVVTLNYRLGLAGFLFLGDIAPGYDEGNVALLDQIAALRWVRDNIARFGGDPEMVTVMGESAGAISIGTLLAMPAARGLFHRVVLQSGAAGLSLQTRDDATRAARDVLAVLDTSIDDLASLPIDHLLAVQTELVRRHGLGAVAPFVDGVSVPQRPIDAIRAGSADGVALLAGSNRDEQKLFEVLLGEQLIDAYKEPVRSWLGPAYEPLITHYRAVHGGSDLRAWVDMIGELAFRIPAIRTAEAMADRGAPVYMYRFDWESPAFGGRLGAAHALELPFVWNRLDLPFVPILLGNDLAALQPLATKVHTAWAQFIKTGDPNGGGLPDWPRYDALRRATLMIDRTCHVVEDPGGDGRALWPSAG
jgi:para-nitrobenzyl esterase